MFWFSSQNKEHTYPTPRPFLSLWWAQSLLLAASGCAMHYCWASIRSGVPESTRGRTLSWRTEDPLTDLPSPALHTVSVNYHTCSSSISRRSTVFKCSCINKVSISGFFFWAWFILLDVITSSKFIHVFIDDRILTLLWLSTGDI